MRAERLAARQALTLLSPDDLARDRLAAKIDAILNRPMRARNTFDLDGAAATMRWIERWDRHHVGKE